MYICNRMINITIDDVATDDRLTYSEKVIAMWITEHKMWNCLDIINKQELINYLNIGRHTVFEGFKKITDAYKKDTQGRDETGN